MSRMAFLIFFPVWPVFALPIYHDKQQTEIYLIMFNLKIFIKSQYRNISC